MTRPDHVDASLRGRRYAIPRATVWRRVVDLVEHGMPRWTLVGVDAPAGIVIAEARTRILSFVDDVRIRVSSGSDAQTRVDLISRSRVGMSDLGTNARRIRRFLRELDRALESPEAILPPEGGKPSSPEPVF